MHGYVFEIQSLGGDERCDCELDAPLKNVASLGSGVGEAKIMGGGREGKE